MVLFETAASKAGKAAQAAEEARRAAEERKRLKGRVEALLRNNRKAEAPAIGGDQRRWERAAGHNAGTARLPFGVEAPCRIQDCAFGGMRLEFADMRSWPDEFVLSVPTLRFLGVVRSVWRDGCERGVEVVRWCETA